MTDALTLCRERIAHWQHMLDQATLRGPLSGREAIRERVVATCAERIGVWQRRLQWLERRAAA